MDTPNFAPQVSVPQWLSLSHDIRLRMHDLFDLPKSGPTIVNTNIIMSDGHTHADLAHLTVEKMQAHLGVQTDNFFELFNGVVQSIQQEKLDADQAIADMELAKNEELKAQKASAIRDLAEGLVEMAASKPKRGRPAKAKA